MADLDSLIGSKISLISHQDIRYDGTLFSINQSESSIVLKDVQVFGTEDRVTDKLKAVPPSPQSLPFVTFPGQEIKDLYVHEPSTTANRPPPAPETVANTAPPAPPAVAKAEKKPVASQNNNKSTGGNAANNRAQQPQQKREDKPRPAAAAQPSTAATTTAAAPKTSEVGTGGHLLKFRERKNGHGATAATAAVDTNFDFEEGLKTFNKEEVLAEVATDKEIAKYAKDDFFDNFSKSTVGEAKPRLTASEERKLNQDTFGAIALQSGYRRGGRGRGGRGGGRSGRGGGRGRGGYRNNSGAATTDNA